MKIIKFLLMFLLIPLLAFADSYSIDENYLKVDQGNIGINTLAPRSRLDVNGATSVGSLGVGVVSNPSIPWDVSDSVISFYKMEGVTGTTVTDAQGVNNGTATADLSTFTTTGIINNGFLFSSTKTINLGSSSTLKQTGPFSVSVWVKYTGTAVQSIASNRNSVAPNVGWRLNGVITTGKASFALDTGSVFAAATSATSINTGAFVHIVGVYNGTTLQLYINGVADGTSASITGDGGTGATNTYLGYYPVTTTNTYTGTSDNFAEFSRALTAAEITQLYNLGVGTDALAGSTASGGAKVSIKADGTTIGNVFQVTDSAGAVKFNMFDNGNLGIGTTTSPNKLYVAGTGEFTGFKLNGNGVAAGYVLTSGTTGIGTWMPAAAGGGGGGTECASSSCNLNVATTLNSQGLCLADGTNCPAAGAGGWTDGGTNVFNSTTTDMVGIGTTTPNASLNIVKQTATAPLIVSSVGGGAGDYFIVNSAGKVGIGTTSMAAGTGISIMNGNVGIGTWNPTGSLQIGTGFRASSTGISLMNGTGVTVNDTTFDGACSGCQVQYGNTSNGSGANTLFYGGSANNSSVSIRSTDHATPSGDYINFVVGIGGVATSAMRFTGGNLGIGTLAPRALLEIGPAAKFAVTSGGKVGIGTINPGAVLTVLGDINTGGTAPTIGTCGTSPAIVAGSTDKGGAMTAGTGGLATSCAITFATTKARIPACWCNHQGAILLLRAVTTTTTLTCDAATPLVASGRIDYGCEFNE